MAWPILDTNHVHQCQRRIPGEDKVGLRFPWADHPSQREVGHTIQETSILRADILQVALRKHGVVRMAHQRREVGDNVRFIHNPALIA